MINDGFGFYAIISDPVAGYMRCAEAVIKSGVGFMQLRMKQATHQEILDTAKRLSSMTHSTGTKLIINDYPEIAAEAGADGVHIGQSDTPYSEARKILGEKSIIGISTHSLEQVDEACALKPDYIGVGPVYKTPTKEIPDPVLGLETMQEMLARASVPGVCIGGINTENLVDVLSAGARNFCMVRELCQSQAPEVAISKILKIYSSFSE